jgi:hypothetical protein
MKDLPHEKQKLLDDSLGVATHRVALKVLETPREGTGGGLRDHARGAEHAATIVPVPPDMEDQYMTWLRALVDIIERSGGGPGRERIVS